MCIYWLIDHLTAHELARDQRQNYGDDITAALRMARKKKFMATEEKCIREETELHNYLKSLIDADFEKLIYIFYFDKLYLSYWLHA